MDVISISDSSEKSMVLVEFTPDQQSRAKSTNHRQSSASQNEVQMVTLNSPSRHSTERCPVTWVSSPKKSHLKFLNSDTFYSPSPRSKVSIWLYSNDLSSSSAVLEPVHQVEPQVSSSLIGPQLNNSYTVAPNRSSILVRQDYKKSPGISLGSTALSEDLLKANRRTNYVNEESSSVIYLGSGSGSTRASEIVNCNHRSTYMMYNTTLNHLDSTNSAHCNKPVTSDGWKQSTPVHLEKQMTAELGYKTPPPKTPRNSTPQPVRNMHNLVENMASLCSSQPATDSPAKADLQGKIKPLASIPLSPETQKKFELCEYLKLMNMNPSDKKAVGLRQNRRSSRVKHLALMSEKRELERKLNSEAQEAERKKSSKGSESDSRHSTDSDAAKGSKLSSKRTTETSESSTTAKREVAPQKPTSESKTKCKDAKAPARFLQVPEVSTTSTPQSKLMFLQRRHSTHSNGASKKKEPKRVAAGTKSPLSRRSISNDAKVCEEPDNRSTSSTGSEVITKKSFVQLYLDAGNLKLRSEKHEYEPVNHKKSPIFSFAQSALNIPNKYADFDECMELILKEEGVSKSAHHKKVETSKNKKLNLSSKDRKMALQRKKVAALQRAPKSKYSKLHGMLKRITRANLNCKEKKSDASKKSKLKKPPEKSLMDVLSRKRYAKHLNRLRSRGCLRQIGIKTLLLKQEQKSTMKKKIRMKSGTKCNKLPEKDFRSTELIQHGSLNTPTVTDAKDVLNLVALKEALTVEDVKMPATHLHSLAIINSCKLELDMLKNLTPEHRKALFESKKFLDMQASEHVLPLVSTSVVQDDPVQEESNQVADKDESDANMEQDLHEEGSKAMPPCYGFEITEINTEKVDKMNETCKNFSMLTSELVTGATVLPGLEASRPSSEDMEVDQLMNCKHMRDQATQKDSETPAVIRKEIEPTGVADPELAGQSRCTTSSGVPSSNSWSMQTVQTDPESNSSVSRQDLIDASYISPSCNIRVPLSHPVVEISSSTREADLKVYRNGYAFPRLKPSRPEVVNISQIPPATCEYVHLPASNASELRSLHQCLTQPRRKHKERSRESSPDNEGLAQSHTILLSTSSGAILNVYYLDFSLVIVQELLVSFWSQTPLGNVLGAQDMWIPKGSTQRLVLGNGCMHKHSSEMVVNLENSVAYIELWTKEHKSDKRERPVADIFIAVYLRLNRGGPNKKVLQLENIHGYASDVQYVVLRNSRSVIVSWSVATDSDSSTLVHCYQLSPDFQTVTSIKEVQTVSHYVSSLHNIEDCDTLLMGCGDSKITLWNIEHGYVVATIDLTAMQPIPRTVWAKSDRGFLFTLHYFDDGALHLLAINSFDFTWKKLQTYKTDQDHDTLLGVCMENGLLVAFYDTGVACWRAQTGELVLEDSGEDNVLLPFGKHVAMLLNQTVHIRHVLEYLLSIEDS